MKGIKATAILGLCLALIIAVVWPAMAEEQRSALHKQYWGTITSIRIDRCRKQPGLCEGVITLAQREGGEVTLAIRPGTWIKCGERLVRLEELRVGHDVHVQGIEIAAERGMRATKKEATTQQ
jgi:hypothetical protein